MIKNLAPLIIVIVIIFVGGLGVYFIMNQKTDTKNIDTTNDNTFRPVTPVQGQNAPTVTSTVSNSQTLPDGLKIEDEKIGTGAEVKSGDTISINYLGTLENGQKFDSSYDRGVPFETQIGVGQVIKGWDEGVVGMRVGGKRRLTIPSSLGYGNQAVGSIPANSTLIFEVELMAIK